jgi:hypothetical protein
MNELDSWLQSFTLRDTSRAKLRDVFSDRGFVQLSDLLLHQHEAEYWTELCVACELNMGEKSRFAAAIKELQPRVPSEVETWASALPLRKSVVDYLVVTQGFLALSDLLFYYKQDDTDSLRDICNQAGMNMGEKARFIQAVRDIAEVKPEVVRFSCSLSLTPRISLKFRLKVRYFQ